MFAMWAVATLVLGGSCQHNATPTPTHNGMEPFACRLPHPLSLRTELPRLQARCGHFAVRKLEKETAPVAGPNAV